MIWRFAQSSAQPTIRGIESITTNLFGPYISIIYEYMNTWRMTRLMRGRTQSAIKWALLRSHFICLFIRLIRLIQTFELHFFTKRFCLSLKSIEVMSPDVRRNYWINSNQLISFKRFVHFFASLQKSWNFEFNSWKLWQKCVSNILYFFNV